MFAISHAIHHFALIKVMARWIDVSLPDDFGMAPSTAVNRGGPAAIRQPPTEEGDFSLL
jgi:hypothetical protein